MPGRADRKSDRYPNSTPGQGSSIYPARVTSGDGLTPEQRARVLIDEQLRAAGWHVCDVAALDLVHHPHTTVREVCMKRGHGQVDYLLYVDRRMRAEGLDVALAAAAAAERRP